MPKTIDITIGYTGAALLDKTQTDSVSTQDVMLPTLTAGAAIASDSFDRVDAATLGTADSGGAWTALTGSWRITNNRAAITSSNSGNMYVAMLPAAAAMTQGTIMCDVQLSPVNGRVGLVMRGTSSTQYMAVDLLRTASADQLSIAKRLTGSTYWVTTSPEGLIAGHGYTLTAILTSTNVTVYVNESVAGSYTFTAQDNTDLGTVAGSNYRVGFRTWDDATSDDDGNSTYNDLLVTSSTTFTPRLPATPLAPVATVASSTSATVTWSIPGNGGSPLTSFTVKSSGGQTYTGISPTATSYSATGLTTGLAQTFTVTAINAVGSRESTPSNSITPVATTVPDAPTGVTASAGDGQATVSWLAPANNGGSPIIDYTVTASPGGQQATTAGLSTTITGLTNNTSYTFTVRARNAVGQSVSSAPSSPVTPTGASIVNGQQITASNTGRVGAAAAGVANYSSTLTTISTVQTYSTSQTIRNTRFTNQVDVTGGTVVFEFCQFAFQPGSGGHAFRQYNGGADAGIVTCNWCDFDCGLRGAQGQFESCGFQAGERGGGNPATTGSTFTLYRCSLQGFGNSIGIHQWRSPGSVIRECYVVDPTTGGGSHPDCMEIYSSGGITIERCRITGAGQSEINITTDFGNVPAGYPITIQKCYINNGGEPVLTRWYNQGPGTGPIYGVSYIGNFFGDTGTAYQYIGDFAAMSMTYNAAYAASNPTVIYWAADNVWAPNLEGVINPAGWPDLPHLAGTQVTLADMGWGDAGSANRPVLVGPAADPMPPYAPRSVSASAGDTLATVTWTAGGNGGSAILDYTVTAYVASTGLPAGRTGVSASSPGNVTLLTNGTAYYFTVKARNALGFSVESGPSNTVTPTGGTITVPGQPTNVAATPGDGLVTVTFAAPGSNGGAVIDNYRATRSPAGQTLTSATVSPIQFTGLTNGTNYTFTVAAHNSAGWGSESAQVSATPTATPATITHGDQLTVAMTGPWALQGVGKGSEVLQTGPAYPAGAGSWRADALEAWTISTAWPANANDSNPSVLNDPTLHGGVVTGSPVMIDGYSIPVGTYIVQFRNWGIYWKWYVQGWGGKLLLRGCRMRGPDAGIDGAGMFNDAFCTASWQLMIHYCDIGLSTLDPPDGSEAFAHFKMLEGGNHHFLRNYMTKDSCFIQPNCDGVEITENWIEEVICPYGPAGTSGQFDNTAYHTNGISCEGNMHALKILRNRIMLASPDGATGSTGFAPGQIGYGTQPGQQGYGSGTNPGRLIGQTDCIAIFAISGPNIGDAVTGIQLRDNLLGGTGYVIYAGNADGQAQNVKLTGNKISTRYWTNGGSYGPLANAPAWGSNGNVQSNNTWADDYGSGGDGATALANRQYPSGNGPRTGTAWV